jgi:hypothetical protein
VLTEPCALSGLHEHRAEGSMSTRP